MPATSHTPSTPPGATLGFTARFARLVADHVRALDLDHHPVLTELGLPEADDSDAPAQWVAAAPLTRALHLAARLTGDVHIGLTLGQQIRPVHMGTLGYALTSVGDLEDGLAMFERLQALVCTQLRAEHRIKGEWIESTLHPQGDVPRDTHLWTLAMVSRLAFARWVLGRPLVPDLVRMPCPAPANPAPVLAYMGCPVIFDAEQGGERVPAAWLALPNPNADAGMHQLMHAMVRQQWTRQAQSGEQLLPLLRQGITQRIQQGLLPLLDELTADLEASLGVSARQVQRRLSEQGLRFKDVVESVRRGQVLHELRHTQLPIAEVAQRAAYSEVSSLHRAVRRWTGMTPLTFRQAPGTNSGDAEELNP